MSDGKENYVYGPIVDLPKITTSVGEFFLKRLEAHGTKTAQIIVIDGIEKTLRYDEILHKGKVAAGFLKQHGVKPNDTVMSVTCNCLEYASVFWGTQFNGATIAPVNPRYELNDMQHLLKFIQPQVVVCDASAVPVLKEALTTHDSPVVFLTLTEIEKYIKEHPDVSDFQVVKIEDPDTQVSSILCTTGSTGKPKCAEISHTTILRQMDLDYLKSPDTDAEQKVSVNVAGPFGVIGQMINLLSINMGMKCLLVPIETYEEVAFLKALEKYRVNFVVTWACQMIGLAKASPSGTYDLSCLKQVIVCGSPISLSMYELAKTNLNVTMTAVYGMTETPGVCNPAYNKTDNLGTVGTLAVNVVAKILDVETGKALGRRQEGEICLKAPSGMLRYRNNPEMNNAAFDDEGFFHTGDTGYFDEEGYLFIVDRIKELIKYQNIHLSGTDIEDVLVLHPAVLETAVIGVYHEVDWEHSLAIVVVKPGMTVTEQELVKLVESKLPRFKWLHGGVKFVDSIPKTLNGKFLKRALRAQYSNFPADLPSCDNKK